MKYYNESGKEISKSSFFRKIKKLKGSATEYYNVYYSSGLSGDNSQYKRLMHEV